MATHSEQARTTMNAHFQQTLTRLVLNAERDARLARAREDQAARATAQARLETLRASLAIYAAAHKWGYGERPWPRPEQP